MSQRLLYATIDEWEIATNGRKLEYKFENTEKTVISVI